MKKYLIIILISFLISVFVWIVNIKLHFTLPIFFIWVLLFLLFLKFLKNITKKEIIVYFLIFSFIFSSVNIYFDYKKYSFIKEGYILKNIQEKKSRN